MRTIRTPKKRALILEAIANGYSVARAARHAGCGRRSIFEWKADDPKFARDFEDAYEEGTDALHDAMVDRALLPDHDRKKTMMSRR
jgi:hypothetical protein